MNIGTWFCIQLHFFNIYFFFVNSEVTFTYNTGFLSCEICVAMSIWVLLISHWIIILLSVSNGLWLLFGLFALKKVFDYDRILLLIVANFLQRGWNLWNNHLRIWIWQSLWWERRVPWNLLIRFLRIWLTWFIFSVLAVLWRRWRHSSSHLRCRCLLLEKLHSLFLCIFVLLQLFIFLLKDF